MVFQEILYDLIWFPEDCMVAPVLQQWLFVEVYNWLHQPADMDFVSN